MTEDEDCLLLLDPSLRFEDDDKALFEDDDFTSLRGVEDDEAIFLLLLEGRFPLEAGMTEEEETFSEDDDDFSTSSFAEVPLSPPQAARATDRIMDAIMLYLKFLILNLVHIPNFFIETI
jgi:hypothetical protein